MPSRRRRAAPRPAPPASSDDDVFIPPNFGGNATPDKCNGVTPDDDDAAEDVFIPPTFGQHEPESDEEPAPQTDDRAELFNRAQELDRMGFTEAGRCKYGCRGTESPHVPFIGWHLRTCVFWDKLATADPDDLPF